MCSLKKLIAKTLKALVLAHITVFSLYPVIWVVLSSLKTNDELFLNTWGLPENWQFINYTNVWKNSSISWAFVNSIVVSLSSLLVLLLVSTMAAFSLTRLKFKTSKLFSGVFLVIMMIPIHTTLIPLFIVFSNLRMNNTYWALILPYVTFGLPVAIFILAGFLKSFPDSLEEAAVIDGAGMIYVFFVITLPVIKPAIATVAIYSFINIWNELLYALVFMSDQKMATIPVALTSFKGMYSVNYTSMLAAIVIAILPSLLIYVFFNQQIITGMTSGAIKG